MEVISLFLVYWSLVLSYLTSSYFKCIHMLGLNAWGSATQGLFQLLQLLSDQLADCRNWRWDPHIPRMLWYSVGDTGFSPMSPIYSIHNAVNSPNLFIFFTAQSSFWWIYYLLIYSTVNDCYLCSSQLWISKIILRTVSHGR